MTAKRIKPKVKVERAGWLYLVLLKVRAELAAVTHYECICPHCALHRNIIHTITEAVEK